MAEVIAFYVFATIVVGAGIGVITAKNPVHSALFLVLAFFTSAAIWLMLEAEFLGLALILVYVGAVMVLFLFVVMMVDIHQATIRGGFARYAPLGGLVTLVMAAEIGWVVWAKQLGAEFMTAPAPAPAGGEGNTTLIGSVMYTEFVYPFEIASLILLVGIIAAIMLTHRRRPDSRYTNVDKQVKTRKEDRLRMVKMRSESRGE